VLNGARVEGRGFVEQDALITTQEALDANSRPRPNAHLHRTHVAPLHDQVRLPARGPCPAAQAALPHAPRPPARRGRHGHAAAATPSPHTTVACGCPADAARAGAAGGGGLERDRERREQLDDVGVAEVGVQPRLVLVARQLGAHVAVATVAGPAWRGAALRRMVARADLDHLDGDYAVVPDALEHLPKRPLADALDEVDLRQARHQQQLRRAAREAAAADKRLRVRPAKAVLQAARTKEPRNRGAAAARA